MIEHVSVPVSNVRKSKAFYTKALKPLGYEPWMAYADAVGFVEGGHARFWIGKQQTVVPMHVAFLARSRKAVHDFHAAALKAGGKDNGKPGRVHCHRNSGIRDAFRRPCVRRPL